MTFSRYELSDGWMLKQKDDTTEGAWLPVAKVPTQVHIDLLANEKIPNPFLDLNELSVRWVGEKDWVYRAQFTCPAANIPHDSLQADLVFEGLDTFASVYLNDVEILKSDNMFVSYRVNVTAAIQHGKENTLEIVFDSALIRGRELIKEHSHEHDFLVRQTEAGRIPVRKAQYNWGWDWGPILMTAGPWRPVYLEQYAARVDDLWAQSEVSRNLKSCSGSVYAKVVGTVDSDKVLLSISKDGETVTEQECKIVDGVAETKFQLQDPELWYPFGYGPQTRYKLTAKIIRHGKEVLDSKSRLTGFRHTELIQEPDSYGKSFYFRINGVDVFAGGSCWIPADSFLSQISRKRYYEWIRLLVEGNQIMIRIWGGGIYEDDSFFDACDELGVLVWHDFQFACASYPAYPSYLKSVELEARQNVRRLRWHPSVVIWAGNNEDYQVQERYKLDYDFENKDPQSWLASSFPARYIYEHLLPLVVKEEDPFNIYHPSSPWGDGKPTADPTVGDIHQWNLWHGTMHKYQEAALLSGRFISEFGLEAYPHLDTIRRMITAEQQQYPGSIAMDFHNKAIDQERRLLSYIAENFQVKYDLGSFTHLTQMMQAEAMRYAYKIWRREWGQAGARKCGGVLVWQLNDCWPTMSWAVVDYYLVKKPGFYAIKRALAPLDVGVARTFYNWTKVRTDEHSGLDTAQVDPTLAAGEGKFEVWVASSEVRLVEAEVSVHFISIKTGQEIAPAVRRKFTVEANGTTEVITDGLTPDCGLRNTGPSKPFNLSQYDPYVVFAKLIVSGETVSSDSAWPQPLKYLDFSERRINFKVSEKKDSVIVSAEAPVKGFVFEEKEGLSLSDNGFDLMPGEEHVVTISGGLDASHLRWTYIGAPEASMRMPDHCKNTE